MMLLLLLQRHPLNMHPNNPRGVTALHTQMDPKVKNLLIKPGSAVLPPSFFLLFLRRKRLLIGLQTKGSRISSKMVLTI